MRRTILSIRKKFLASLLATLIVLTPAARAQTLEDLFWRQFLGNMIIVTVLVFIVVRTKYPYAEGREAADREASLKDKVKLEDQEVEVNVFDDWFNMDGLSPNGDVDPMEGSITTKNNKTYKIFSYQDSEGMDDFNQWVEDYVAANGSEEVDVETSSMKGKLKLGKDGTVKFKLAIKYKGTQATGENFGGKAKGKMKFKGTLADDGPIPN